MKLTKRLTAAALSLMMTISAMSFTVNAAAISTPKLTQLKNSANGVAVKWGACKNADSYKVFRKTAKTAFKEIATVKGNAKTSYTDKKAKSNVKYSYAVKACQGKKLTAMSKSKSLLCVGTPKVTLSNKYVGMNVSWAKISGATKYAVSIKKQGDKAFKLAYAGKKTSFVYDVAMNNTAYDVMVKAVIGKTSGAYSTPQTKWFLDAPTDFFAEEFPDSLEGITLDWSMVEGADGYIIYRSLRHQDSFKKIAKIKEKGPATNKERIYIDTTCVSVNSYKYYVVAYKGADKSYRSNIDWDVYMTIPDEKTPLEMTIKKGQVYDDICKKLEKYGAEGAVKWTNQNKDILSISDKGVIKGLKKGVAKVIVTGEYKNKKRRIQILVTVK